MSIEKKSLISTLKTTKKANAVSSEISKPANVTSKKMRRNVAVPRATEVVSTRRLTKSARASRRAIQN